MNRILMRGSGPEFTDDDMCKACDSWRPYCGPECPDVVEHIENGECRNCEKPRYDFLDEWAICSLCRDAEEAEDEVAYCSRAPEEFYIDRD